ncbi:unnamed protein product [Rangifer tarandus platyrhynchus]|uniref:Uncharacterized protein n=2 Tax=Rangifer tarandus platyrhynchus TaxID=3082113 RepID=A0ACB0F9W0_RANTA|nr:unnamed protein product [Rangifer tarandus platyrhynchus]CAI9709785.1 unnamed protein product [Rangifer tarandus platyrhynchus]
MGITRRTRGRSLRPARPIPAEEGSDQRSANTRVAARVGRGLAAGDFGSRRLRLRSGAVHHGLAPGAKAGPLGRRAWARREAAERTTRALGAGRRLWGRGQEAGADCRLLAQLAARVAAQSRGLAGCPPPPPPWAPEGALRAESHSGAEAPGTPSRTGSWAPSPPSRFARLECYLCRKLLAVTTATETEGGTKGGRPPKHLWHCSPTRCELGSAQWVYDIRRCFDAEGNQCSSTQ